LKFPAGGAVTAWVRRLAWAVPLAAAVGLMLLRRPVVVYRNGVPPKDELMAYAEAHRGTYPPLPTPTWARYLILEAQGLSWFSQSAVIVRRGVARAGLAAVAGTVSCGSRRW
jgi:hypothetical protein